MPAKKWTDEQRAQALEAFREHGPAEAERLTGIKRATISSWAHREGVQSVAPARTAAATRAAEQAWAQRRARLADKAGQAAETLLDRMFDTTEARDAKALVDAAREAAGVAQLLSGGVTSRTEDVTDPNHRLSLVKELRTREQQASA